MTIRTILGVVLICLGVVVVLIAALGLFRFKETLDLIHAGALADTMGVFLVLAGVMVLWGGYRGFRKAGPGSGNFVGDQPGLRPPDCPHGAGHRPGHRA